MREQSIQVVWHCWKINHSGGLMPHPKVAEAISHALASASVESLVTLLEWWRDETTPKSDPVYWRLERPHHGLADVLNGQKLESRLAESAAWHDRGRVAAIPTGPPESPALSPSSTPTIKKRILSTPIPGAPNGNPSSTSASTGTLGKQLQTEERRSMG
jgi:hypothetical protein